MSFLETEIFPPKAVKTCPASYKSSPRSHYVALVLVLLLFASVRLRLRNMPLERDEGEYAYVGQLILQGIPPYKLAFNMKLPGTYVVYAVVMGIFGQTIVGIRIGILLLNALTTLLVFLLGRRVFGSLAGIVAAATYALLSNRVSLLSLDGHATHFVALGALAGTLLLLRAIDTQRTSWLFWSGLCYGLAFLMKQHGIFLSIFGVLYWIWSRWRAKIPTRGLATQGLALMAGIILPFLVTCLSALGTGVFGAFWFWTFTYGSKYVAIVSYRDGWNMFRTLLPWVLRPLVISGIAAFGLISMIWNAQARRQGVFLVGYLVFSFLGVIPGLYFRSHYFIPILIPLALLVGVGIRAAQQLLQEHSIKFAPAWLPVVFFILTFLTALYGHRKFLFQMEPVAVNRYMHKGQACAESITVANYLQSHSSPGDQVAILGSEPEVFFYSHRHSATGYMYVFPLMEKQPLARQMTEQFIGQIENSHPRYIIYEDNQLAWGWQYPLNDKKYIFDWMQAYLSANYQLEAEIPIVGDPYHHWGNQPEFHIYQLKPR